MRRILLTASVVAALISAYPARTAGQRAPAPRGAEGAPSAGYTLDPTWPKLPNNWVVGISSWVTIDSHGNVWLLHRPRSVAPELAGRAAPAVIELDARGGFIRAWGGPGAGYEWPAGEHGILVDAKDQVWISGNAAGDHMLLKFTADGRFLAQYGKRGASKGNNDTTNVNRAADMTVYPRTNELFVADGYGNRRVAVYDADTFAFKRMWGAFGNRPVDRAVAVDTGAPAAQPDPGGDGVPQFDLVHAIRVSDDGLVYVADRPNRRVQVFTVDGTYRSQVFLNRDAMPSAAGLAFSADPGQTRLYVADYGNSQVFTLDRKTLAVMNVFGMRGAAPGLFQGVHSLAADAQGNLYTAEVAPGNRFQKFVRATPLSVARP